MTESLELWWAKGQRRSTDPSLWGHVAYCNDFVVYWKMGDHWKVWGESDRIWLTSWKRHSRSYAEKRLKWRKGKYIRPVNKLFQLFYWEMIMAWTKVVTVRDHHENAPLRSLTTGSILKSIHMFWYRPFFPWATQPTGKQGKDSTTSSFLDDAEILSQVTLA